MPAEVAADPAEEPLVVRAVMAGQRAQGGRVRFKGTVHRRRGVEARRGAGRRRGRRVGGRGCGRPLCCGGVRGAGPYGRCEGRGDGGSVRVVAGRGESVEKNALLGDGV
eukprot:scaffold3393_cov101-Isochrysis_galbana.AAC.7